MANTKNTAVAETNASEVAVLHGGPTNIDLSRGYSSITGTDLEARKRVYTAVANSEKISDHLNKPFHLVDILIANVSSESEDTGEIEEYQRTTLLAADGVAYSANSTGIVNSVDTLLRAIGEPHAFPEGGLEIKVVERKGKKGYFFSIELL